MIIHFPTQNILELALSSQAAPPAVWTTPVQAGWNAQGLWVRPTTPLSADVLERLKQLGARVADSAPGDVALASFLCWPQLVPLAKLAGPVAHTDQTPVLFEVPAGDRFARLVMEMLRLGNDRQAFRAVTTEAGPRMLLRVMGPPYYTMLQSLDRGDDPDAPIAFYERGARVWIEAGHTHPLAGRITPPAGTWLFMRPARNWVLVPEGKFRDVYEATEFSLPRELRSWSPIDLDQRLRAPLRLAAQSAHDAPEMWVLRGRGIEQLDALVRDSSDSQLAKLSFAVGGSGDDRTVVLRVRPSTTKQSPPTLVLDGVEYRSYLKVSHLFLPTNARLHPPLRRDAVVKLLASDSKQITWLQPTDGQGGFQPQSLPDSAFRPLSDWVDYVLDAERDALAAWMQATQFEFEPFVCDDEQKTKPKPDAAAPEKMVEAPDEPTKPPVPEPTARAPKKTKAEEPDKLATLTVRTVTPSQQQARLNTLEASFLAFDAPLDAPERHGAWVEMGRLNSALGHSADSTVCWINALWQQPEPALDDVRGWLESENQGRPPFGEGDEIARVLANPRPSSQELRSLAAWLCVAAAAPKPPAAATSKLPAIQRFLETHESFLPVRAAWLAWTAAAKLAGGDVLALARSRDRLLERLYQHGLSPDVDLPSFLRRSGPGMSDRFRRVRERVVQLRPMAQEWVKQHEPSGVLAPQTALYADLMFAFALARVGEKYEAEKILDAALHALSSGSDASKTQVHRWLAQAFEYRIRQALGGKPIAGQLPHALLQELEQMKVLDQYVVNKLRQTSNILEPHEALDAFRRIHADFQKDPLSKALLVLGDVIDRVELTDQVTRLRTSVGGDGNDKTRYARVVSAALELAPRLGDAYTQGLLADVTALAPHADGLQARLELLQHAIVAAAHFDQGQAAARFLDQFYAALDGKSGGLDLKEEGPLERLLLHMFRALRKLGMRQEMTRLLEVMDAWLRSSDGAPADKKRGRTTSAQDAQAAQKRSLALRMLLHVAAGWFYVGQNTKAQEVVDEARRVLFHGDLQKDQQAGLACAYASALSQAPAELALRYFEEMFKSLKRVYDTFSTGQYYARLRLNVVESVVMAMASDDFTLDERGRRWLDDDEYLVRRRIHRDMRAAEHA